MSQNHTVISADPQTQKSSILSIWHKNTSKSDADEVNIKFDWCNNDNNPGGWRQYWFLKDTKNDDYIGTISMSIRKYKVWDQSFYFYRGADFMVNKEHRKVTPAKFLISSVHEELKNQNKSIIGCPNRAATAIMMRSGVKSIGAMSNYVKVIKSAKYLSRIISSKLVVKLVSFPIDLMIMITGKEIFNNVPLGQKIAHLTDFDARFDDLWKGCKIDLPIIGDRSSKYLKWRYNNNPFREYLIFSFIGDNESNLHGYIIYYIENDQAYISDIFACELSIMQSLLIEFSKYTRSLNLSAVRIGFFGKKDIHGIFKNLKFYKRPNERNFVFSPGINTDSIGLMQDPENWYFMMGDEEEED